MGICGVCGWGEVEGAEKQTEKGRVRGEQKDGVSLSRRCVGRAFACGS